MPWTPEQWRAIAVNTIRKYGKEEGRRKLHQYKVEAGGHAVTHRRGVHHLKRKMKHG